MRRNDGCVHFSDLKCIDKSPRHYQAAIRDEKSDTKPKSLGSLVHCLVLGGRYVVYEGERRGNAWKEFAAENAGKLIATAKEYELAEAIAEAVVTDPVAAPYLAGPTERSWRARMYGLPCAGTIDVSGKGFTADLKTTFDASPSRFERQCLRMGYHAQLANYADARIAMNEDPGTAVIIGVESKAPHCVTVFELTPRALDEGRKLLRLWYERLRGCLDSNQWPGYAQSALPLDVVEDAGLIIDTEEEAA